MIGLIIVLWLLFVSMFFKKYMIKDTNVTFYVMAINVIIVLLVIDNTNYYSATSLLVILTTSIIMLLSFILLRVYESVKYTDNNTENLPDILSHSMRIIKYSAVSMFITGFFYLINFPG